MAYLEKNLIKSPPFCQICEDESLNLEEYTVSEVTLTDPLAPLANRSLKETRLQDCGILVLSIERNGHMTHVPRGSEMIVPGDKLLIYGRQAQIKKYAGQAM